MPPGRRSGALARSIRGTSPTPGGVDPLAGGDDGHGTCTASVICGFDRRYRGVAPKVPLMPVRIGARLVAPAALPAAGDLVAR
jgi:hypothetical protein